MLRYFVQIHSSSRTIWHMKGQSEMLEFAILNWSLLQFLRDSGNLYLQ